MYQAIPIVEPPLGAEGEQIRRLEALISTDAVQVRTPADSKATVIPSLVELIDANELDEQALDPLLHALTRNDKLLRALVGLASMDELSATVRRFQRIQALDDIQEVINEPGTDVTVLRQLLRRHAWVFGGHLLPWLREEIIPGLDDKAIPLLRYDGAIHIVLVEPPHVPRLVTRDGDLHVVSPLVGRACDQARDLVRALERQQDAITDRLPVVCGRPHVTIVVGLSDPLDTSVDVRDEIRVYSSFQSGINVIMYDELLEIAKQTLDLDHDRPGSTPHSPAA